MAPEVLDNQNYNFAADFYSIGAILYELLTGVPPYYSQAEDDDQQRLALMKSMAVDLPKATGDPHLQSLLAHLLHPDPDQRISNFQEIKNSPWLAGVDWKAVELKQETLPFAPDPSAPIDTYIGK
jgi:serine/threonine protein kinase